MANNCLPTVAAVVDYQRVLQEAAGVEEHRRADGCQAQGLSRRDRQAGAASVYEAERELVEAAIGERSFPTKRSSAKQEELEAELQAVRELTQKRRQQLEQVSAAAVSKVERALFEVLTTSIAEERGLNVVSADVAGAVLLPSDRSYR